MLQRAFPYFIPLVLVDNFVAEPEQKADAVLSDNYDGAMQVVRHLISLGHRQIAFINWKVDNDIYTFKWRKEGYLAALREAGIPLSGHLIYDCHRERYEAIEDICKELLEQDPPVSAIFCANDLLASYFISGLYKLNIRVPDDISVVGFDDVDIARHIIPSLTTVHVHKATMGATAVKALLARAANPQSINVTYTLGVQLIVRDSVRPIG